MTQEGQTQKTGKEGGCLQWGWELSGLLLQAGEGSCEVDVWAEEADRREVERRPSHGDGGRGDGCPNCVPSGADSGHKPKDGFNG